MAFYKKLYAPDYVPIAGPAQVAEQKPQFSNWVDESITTIRTAGRYICESKQIFSGIRQIRRPTFLSLKIGFLSTQMKQNSIWSRITNFNLMAVVYNAQFFLSGHPTYQRLSHGV